MSSVSVRDQRDKSAEARSRAEGLNVGWTVFSYLLSGMAAYGGIGWLVGRAVHVPLLFPAGMLVGLAISLGFVIWRYGRHETHAQTRATQPARAAQPTRAAQATRAAQPTRAAQDTETGTSAPASRRTSHRRVTPREETSR